MVCDSLFLIRQQSVEDFSEYDRQVVTGRSMHIDTTINSVKVTFDLQTRESDVTKNVAKNLTTDSNES